MIVITKETCKNDYIEVIVDNNDILWHSKKHKEKKSGNEYLPVITINYHFGCRKHRIELVNKPE